VSHGRSKVLEELAKRVAEILRTGGFSIVRNVVAQAEVPYIQQLVSNVSNDNEADAIVMIGGTGFGPHDHTCEAVEAFVERRIEGFGEAYRRLLREELKGGARAMLSRATAGVYNRCVVFALTGRLDEVTRATQELIVPALPEAVAMAAGRHVHTA
jgi:molybdenum cofactor biosynthesis protein B